MAPVQLALGYERGECGKDVMEAAELGGTLGAARSVRGHRERDFLRRDSERNRLDLVGRLFVRELGAHCAPSAGRPVGGGSAGSTSASRSLRIATRSRVRAVSGDCFVRLATSAGAI